MEPFAKGMLLSPTILAAIFSVTSVANAQSQFCSVATLEGGYWFFVQATILPAGTPGAILGRLNFDQVSKPTQARA
jgi:hypothetical protein